MENLFNQKEEVIEAITSRWNAFDYQNAYQTKNGTLYIVFKHYKDAEYFICKILNGNVIISHMTRKIKEVREILRERRGFRTIHQKRALSFFLS